MPSKNWKITNSNTKDISVVLIDAYPDLDEVLPSAFFYEQELSMIQPVSGNTYVKPGGTDNSDTFKLPDAHKDINGNIAPFTFIVADAATLAPITAVTCRADQLDSLADLEITDDMFDNMDNADDFVKNIYAYPTSDLAVDFAEKLKNGDNMDQFFLDTKDYKDLKLDDVLLMISYYKALPYGWADGRNTTFFMYSDDYKNNTDSDEPIGELYISNEWTAPLPVKPNKDKFKIELKTYDDKKTVTLIFKDGAFWDDPDTDIPKIALAASFIMPSQLTMENSQNAIVAYVVGTLNGYKVFGLSDRAPHDQDEKGGFLDLFNTHNFKEKLDLAMYFITIGMGISFFVSCYYAVKYLVNKFKSDDALEIIEKAKEIKEFITANNEILATRLNGGVRPEARPAEVLANQVATRAQLLDAATRQAKVNIQQMVDQQKAGYKAISNKVVNEDILNALEGLDRVQTYIDINTLADFRGHLAEMTTALTNSNVTLIANKTHINGRLSNTERQAYDRAREIYDIVLEQQTRNTEEIRDIENRRDEREVEAEEFEIVRGEG